jgi:hypothetical protein
VQFAAPTTYAVGIFRGALHYHGRRQPKDSAVRFAMKVFALFSLAVFVVTAGAATCSAQEETKPAIAPQTASQSAPQAAPQTAVQSAATPAPDKSKIVYVSDFELDALDAEGKVEKNVAADSLPTAATSDPNRPEAPTEQASRLIDFMSTTLVKELEKAGYTAHRLRPNDDRPTDGIGIKGIFAEPDDQNRLRRAVLGTITVAGKMALFVGIGNLARPDQALYAVASTANAEEKSPTVITVSAYAPVAKFEIEKNVTEKAIKDTASNIVADLNALLGVNVVALVQ